MRVPAIEQTIIVANILPYGGCSPSGKASAGVHMKTNEYIAASKHDAMEPVSSTRRSFAIVTMPFESEPSTPALAAAPSLLDAALVP